MLPKHFVRWQIYFLDSQSQPATCYSLLTIQAALEEPNSMQSCCLQNRIICNCWTINNTRIMPEFRLSSRNKFLQYVILFSFIMKISVQIISLCCFKMCFIKVHNEPKHPVLILTRTQYQKLISITRVQIQSYRKTVASLLNCPLQQF